MLGQGIIGRRPLSRFVQIDRLVARYTGIGSQTTAPVKLPHARYTVFINGDRLNEVRAFTLQDEHDVVLVDDHNWGRIPPNHIFMPIPLVQHEVPTGRYRMSIGTVTAACAWEIQVVLNSMMSWQTTPRPWRRTVPLPDAIRVRSGEKAQLRIARTGLYNIYLLVEEEADEKKRFAPFTLQLEASDGYRVDLAQSDGFGLGTTEFVFLGAGDWSVRMSSQTDWQLGLMPRTGPMGGGAQAF